MKTSILSQLLGLIVILTGCQSEDQFTAPIISSQLEVRVSANTLALPEVDHNTEFGNQYDENTIREIQLIVFDERDTYLDSYNVINNKVSIPRTPNKRTIYVVANAQEALDQASAQWTPKITTIDQVLESLYQERNETDMPQFPFAMYAKLMFPNGINNNSAITDNGTHTGSPLLLKRNVAKVTVTTSPILASSFKIKQLMLCKAPKSGYLIKSSVRDITNVSNYKLTNASNSLYSYVASAETTIIIEADVINNDIQETRYFKIAIKESAAHGANGLQQNHWYKITLNSKTGIGFATLDQAIHGHVFDHIETTMEVSDITMHDFIFGKDLFIATSNSHYEQYGYKTEEHYYEICKVRFANITSSNAILGTTSIQVISGAVALHPHTIAEIEKAQNNVTYSVMAKFTAPATYACIRIQFDTLSKDILIKTQPQPDNRSDQFIEIPNSVVGTITDHTLTWCGINDAKTFTQNKILDTNTAAGSTLYLTLQGTSVMHAAREVIAFFSRTKTGMTKVSVYQNQINI